MKYFPPLPPKGMPLDVQEECKQIGKQELGLTFFDEFISFACDLLKNGNDSIEVGIAKAKEGGS